MKVIFTKIAKDELEDASDYYEIEPPGLGKRFKNEVKASISRIRQYPKAWAVERGEIRKCLLHTFPYKVLYSIENN